MTTIRNIFSVISLLSVLLVAPSNGIAAEPGPTAPATLRQEVPAAKPEAPPTAPSAAKEAEPGKVRRIGYVEMSRFGSETEAGKAVRSQLQKKSDSYRSQIVAKQKQLDKQKKGIQEKLSTLSPKQREAKAKEFEKKVEEYQQFVKKAEKELLSLEDELSRKLYSRIEEAATACGKAKGYEVIVVKKELLYVSSAVEAEDVTEEVMKRLPPGL